MAQFRACVDEIQLNSPQIPFVSNLDGGFVDAAQVMHSDHWVDHLRQTVLFGRGINTLFEDDSLGENKVFVEVGPGPGLCSLVKKHTQAKNQQILATIASPQTADSEQQILLNSLANMWLNGVNINWQGFQQEQHCRRVPLPTYPFERQRHWIDNVADNGQQGLSQKSMQTRHYDSSLVNAENCFYTAGFSQVPVSTLPLRAARQATVGQDRRCIVLLMDKCGVADALGQKLQEGGDRVIWVQQGVTFEHSGQDRFSLNVMDKRHYLELATVLAKEQVKVDQLLYLFTLTDEPSRINETDYRVEQDTTVLSGLIYLLQAFTPCCLAGSSRLD
ncbi:MAG: hypothetical protein MJK04_18400, partial [Psychrosphaera sp.]|nr:hypothetical protein [Psychrosphaera sp.]